MYQFSGYRMTSAYGPRKNPFGGGMEHHKGVDLCKGHKAKICAFVGGKVLYAGWGNTGTGLGNYGNVVCVQDPKGALHVYAHLHRNLVNKGDVVKIGDVIGEEGSTGASTGSHLHYEIRIRTSPSWGLGSDVNPVDYLTKYFEKKQDNVNVYVSNKIVGKGRLVDGTTYVPVRAIVEALGLKVDWVDGDVKIHN